MSATWLHTLPVRAALLRSLRTTLDEAGFIEVETPVRIPAPANEPHILPPPSGTAFLRASPELQMKRLLALGFTRIYQIGPCFRSGERGDRHNPEFTLLEWYRADADDRTLLGDLRKLVCDAAAAIHGCYHIPFRGTTIDLSATWTRMTVRDAMLRHAGWDPVADYHPERFDVDMATKVEPALPRNQPCLLVDYPAPAAALARLRDDDPTVAHRWEAYIGGIELCNAYGELTDPEEQRRRFEAARVEKIACGETPMPIDEDFLGALSSLPPCAGAAMGVDRLAMILLDAADISHVRPFCPPVGALW